MSVTVTIPNAFAAVTSATTAQLDANFAACVTGFTNCAAQAGSASQIFSGANGVATTDLTNFQQTLGLGQTTSIAALSSGVTYTNSNAKGTVYSLYVQGGVSGGNLTLVVDGVTLYNAAIAMTVFYTLPFMACPGKGFTATFTGTVAINATYAS